LVQAELSGPKGAKNADHNSLPLGPDLPWWEEVMRFVAGEDGGQ
jgi:hypothetical protein